MARKTKLTPEVQAKIAAYVQGGATIPHACEAASISWNTVKEWLKPEQAKREPYRGFVEAMDAAKARWAAGAAMAITAAGKKDWHALAWMLERRHPEEYSVKTKIEHTGKDGAELFGKEPAKMSLAEMQAEMAQLAEEAKGKVA